MTVLNRRQIRYFLRRLRSKEESGVELPELPEGFRKSFEGQDKFRGWLNYQKTWDVDDSGWSIIFLDKSLEEQWHEILLQKVPELPSGTESNI
jgi:hypothetical protein